MISRLKVWPLTHVRRWASSANSFNLDFGDHDLQYYSVQTTEGEAISALIAGYIDIIVRQVCISHVAGLYLLCDRSVCIDGLFSML